jgi:hypothetical protein
MVLVPVLFEYTFLAYLTVIRVLPGFPFSPPSHFFFLLTPKGQPLYSGGRNVYRNFFFVTLVEQYTKGSKQKQKTKTGDFFCWIFDSLWSSEEFYYLIFFFTRSLGVIGGIRKTKGTRAVASRRFQNPRGSWMDGRA